MRKLLLIPCLAAIMLIIACGGKGSSDSDPSFNPRDTVVVPEGVTGEDSIAYIEEAILQSPISSDVMLGLTEVYSLETQLLNYNNFSRVERYPEDADICLATQRDSAAIRLANRFLSMADLVKKKGDANDKLQWAIAVNSIVDKFRKEVPSVPSDSVLDEICRVIKKFSMQTTPEMEILWSAEAAIDYCRTIEAYRNRIESVPNDLRLLVQEEFRAWHDFNEARFAFWRDVSSEQEEYRLKTMVIEGFYEWLSKNRRAELKIESDIILKGKPYQQKGQTVTTSEWEAWITKNSVPEDIESLREWKMDFCIPSDSLVAERVATFKSTFSRWIKARQAITTALPKGQGDSYNNLTSDIHCRIIGKLDNLFPF